MLKHVKRELRNTGQYLGRTEAYNLPNGLCGDLKFKKRPKRAKNPAFGHKLSPNSSKLTYLVIFV